MIRKGQKAFFGQFRLALSVFTLSTILWTIPLANSQQTMQSLHVPLRSEVVQGKAQEVGKLPAERHMHLTLSLPLQHQDEMGSLLHRLYDPASPDFHKFLDVEEFTKRFGPSTSDYQAVLDYAGRNGLTVLSTAKNRMLIELDGTVDRVNSAFHVAMKEYRHPTENRTFFSADRQPALDLAVPLAGIVGLENYVLPHRVGSKGQTSLAKSMAVKVAAQSVQPSDATSTVYNPPNPTGSGPYNSYIPTDFRAAYYGDGPLTGKGQTLGLFEYNGYETGDLALFYNTLGTPQPAPIYNVLLGGLTAPLGDGGDDAEAMGDIVFAMSVATHLDQLRIYECCSTDYTGDTAAPAVILSSMASENIAKQISVSAGWGPDPAVYDPIYEEMAAQGQTVFEASGDWGSNVNPGNDGITDSGYADNAWITAVGMSAMTTQSAGGAWLSDTYDNGSGGGYSDGPNPVLIPSYQVPAINKFNGGSTVYRNYPDVVANGDGMFLCGTNNSGSHCYPSPSCQDCYNGGSSYATPIWASLMALVNEEAANEGKPSIGFINPAIYNIGLGSKYANDFHDVIGGNNDFSGQPLFYYAVPGYDLVSGFGSPIGVNLIHDLVNQAAGFSLAPSANSLSIGPNDSTSAAIAIQPSGSTVDPVTFTVSGLPSGVTASFSSNPASGSTTVSFTSGISPQVGTATVTVQGVAGSQTASTTIALTITSSDGNFTIGAPVTSFALAAGTSANGSVTVTGFDNLSSAVTLGATGLPAGVTLSYPLAQLNFNGGNNSLSSSFTITVANTAAAGTFPVYLTGTSGSIVNRSTIFLVISPGTAGLTATTLGISPGANVTPGQTVTLTATITSADSSTATGTSVQFYDNGVPLGGPQAYANGTSSYQDANIAAGNHTFTAAFTGTGIYGPSTSPAATLFVPLVQAAGSVHAILTETVTIGTAGTLGNIYVLTTGQANLDYTYSSGGTCVTGATYAVNATCTVNYLFKPKAPGQRLGAVQLVASDGVTVLGTSLLTGTGLGASAVFPGNTGTVDLGSGFNNPNGVAVDATGNVYVADAGNGVVKEIVAVGGSTSPNSTVLTLGSGFSYPVGIAVDGAGNVYVADYDTNAVTEIVAVGGSIPANNPTMLSLGSGLNSPLGLAVDGGGNVYVADSGNNAIEEIVAVGGVTSSNSTMLTLGGGFNSPYAVAVDGAGNVYVADYGNAAVKEIVAVGGSVPNYGVTINTLGSGFSQPQGVAVDSVGNVYVEDGGNNAVEEIVAVGGSVPASNPTVLTLGGGFSGPFGIALDVAGNVYVADSNNNSAVKEIPVATPPSLSFPSTEAGSASSPQTVVLQNIGNDTLTFPVPASGSNPSIGSGFALDSSATCPQATAGGTAASLAAGSSCDVAIAFQPTQAGINTSSVLLTDNSLGMVDSLGNGAAVQTIALSGTAVPSSQVPQTISFVSIPAQTAGSTHTLTASATSNLPVSFVTTTPNICAVSGSAVTSQAPGTCSVQATQPGNSSYLAAPTVTQSFSVSQLAQSISFGTITGQLAGTTLTLSANATSGLPVTFATTSTSCSISGTALTTLTAGTCAVQASQAGSIAYQAARSVTQSFAITLHSQTITFTTVPQQFPGASYQLVAVASSQLPVTFATTTPGVCTLSGTTLSSLAIGTCTVQASQAGNNVYKAATGISRNIAVKQLVQTINFASIPAQTAGVPLTLSPTASSGLPVVFGTTSTTCSIYGSVVTPLAPGTCSIQATQPGNSSYLAAVAVTRAFTISQRSQTITFAAIPSQLVGTSLTLSPAASSQLPVSLAVTTPAVCALNGNTLSTMSPGTCTVQVTQPGNVTYKPAAAVARSFTVAQTAQSISFAAIPGQFVGTTLTLSATATSGLPVTYSTTSAACSVSGTTLSTLLAGTCTVTASQAGNNVYKAAANVGKSFSVSQQSQGITFTAIPAQFVGASISLSATATSQLNVVFSTTSIACKISGTTLTTVAAGTCTVQATQSGNIAYKAAPSVSRSFTVSQYTQSIQFRPALLQLSTWPEAFRGLLSARGQTV